MDPIVVDDLWQSSDRRLSISTAVMKQDHRMLLGKPERGSLPDDRCELRAVFGWRPVTGVDRPQDHRKTGCMSDGFCTLHNSAWRPKQTWLESSGIENRTIGTLDLAGQPAPLPTG
jgi:hypothetical protein